MRKLTSLRAYGFLAPFLVLFIFVLAYPVLYGAYLSLFGQRGARMWWVGFGNYASVITDPQFWGSFGIPAFLLFVQVPLMLILSTIIGLLYEQIRHSHIYRLIFYLPYAMPGIVAAIMWGYIFSKSMSPLIPLLAALGVKNAVFLTQSSVAWVLLIIILWEWTGYTSLIIYSTLVSIPKEYGEQAQLDGANLWQVSMYIKVPLLRNTVILLFIFNSIGALQVFNEPFIIGSLLTLPPNYTPAMYIYNEAFNYGSFTYAIAMGLILAIVIFIISFFFLRSSMKQLDAAVR